MVGVQIEFVGQGPLLPTVQGIAGGRVVGVKQRPLFVIVRVSIESSTRRQVIRYILLNKVKRGSPATRSLSGGSNDSIKPETGSLRDTYPQV